MIHIGQYTNNVILSISTFTLSGSLDMTAKGVFTISSFITVLCKLKLSVSTQLVNSIHVDMFHTLAVVYQ